MGHRSSKSFDVTSLRPLSSDRAAVGHHHRIESPVRSSPRPDKRVVMTTTNLAVAKSHDEVLQISVHLSIYLSV